MTQKQTVQARFRGYPLTREEIVQAMLNPPRRPEAVRTPRQARMKALLDAAGLLADARGYAYDLGASLFYAGEAGEVDEAHAAWLESRLPEAVAKAEEALTLLKSAAEQNP